VNVTTETRVSPAAHVSIKALDERAVLVNLHTGQCWELNEVAFSAWRLLADGASIAKAAQAIAARYAVASDVSERDVLDLVRSLADQKLVVPRTPDET
jgi:hypothetical protein